MIIAKIKKEENRFSEITVSGHASAFYFDGNVIQKFIYFLFSSFFKNRISLLCCAVSVLFKTLELSLYKRNLLVDSIERGGYLQLFIKGSVIANFICEIYMTGVYQLQKQYPNEFRIEVYND